MNMDYVSRMVYNKDKDIVFVYKPDGFWNEREYIYEMHHLEQMVPFAVTAIKNMSMQKDDGIVTVYDMNTRDNLKFYNEDKYWNLDIKDEFMGQTRNLWLVTSLIREMEAFSHYNAQPLKNQLYLSVK